MNKSDRWQVYNYDGDGHRVKRNVNGTETWQVYGVGGELLAEYSQSGDPSNPQKEYGYRNGQLLVTAEPSANVHWLVADQLGSPRMIFDSTGLTQGTTLRSKADLRVPITLKAILQLSSQILSALPRYLIAAF